MPPTSPSAKHATAAIELSISFWALRLSTPLISVVSPWGIRHLRRLDCSPEHWWRPRPQLSVARALHGVILGMDPYTLLTKSFFTRSSVQFGVWRLGAADWMPRRHAPPVSRAAPPRSGLVGEEWLGAVDQMINGADSSMAYPFARSYVGRLMRSCGPGGRPIH